MKDFNQSNNKIENSSTKTSSALKEATFLLVEDIKEVTEKMAHDLRELEFTGKFYIARDLSTAQRIFDKQEIDIIISDWILPDGESLSFLDYVKKQASTRHVPFIMCTAIDDVGKMLKAVQAGVSEYIVKPWDYQTLESKLELTWEDAERERFNT